MKNRRRLFLSSDIYNLSATDGVFVGAMKENIEYHTRSCDEYRRILKDFNFDINSLCAIEDLHKIPPLPTSYLKNNTLLSKPHDKLLIKTTSSGTGGAKTLSGFDAGSAFCGLFMILRIFHYHKLISPMLTNYIILGYRPDKLNQTAMAKALKGFTMFAPAKKIEYALKRNNGVYEVNTDSLIDSVVQFGKQSHPIRILGFPAYFKMLADELDKRNIKLKPHESSKIMLGGGWKGFFSEEISKEELFQRANDIFGISRENFKEQFGTAEHPVNYVACINNHFHVPIYGRVLIRDAKTLAPAPNGSPGLLNLITPLLTSAPYGSIITDDIAVMRDGAECGCGISSPFFEILGRVGLSDIKTCTQRASEFIEKI